MAEDWVEMLDAIKEVVDLLQDFFKAVEDKEYNKVGQIYCLFYEAMNKK